MIDIIDKLLTPFIASNISLLFALMSRNATISQRIREACRELISDTCPALRRDCLFRQIDDFAKRYTSNKWTIVSILVAVASFLLAIVLWKFLTPVMTATIFLRLIVILFIGLSMVTFFLAIILTLKDFIRATRTLNWEIDFALGRYEPKYPGVKQEEKS
jgi:hypothetical protein